MTDRYVWYQIQTVRSRLFYEEDASLEAESAGPVKVDYGLAARTALQNVQQELGTKEVEQGVRSELESKDLRGKFDILEKTTKEEDKRDPESLD